MSILPSRRDLQDFSDWLAKLRVPWVSLLVLVAALIYAVIRGFTVGRILLVVLCAIVAGFRYLRVARGSLKMARYIAAEAARTRTPIPRTDIPLRVSDSLIQDELVIVQTRLHPIVTIKYWLLAATAVLLVPVGAIVVGNVLILLLLAVLALAYASYQIVDWQRSILYVTDSRILFLHGVFKMALAETPIKKVTDKDTEERFFPTTLARLRIIWLPYGRLGIETAGQEQWISVLAHIPNAMMVGKIISEYAHKSK